MPDSPLLKSSEIFSCEILINGQPILNTIGLERVQVEQKVNSISSAKITILLPMGSSENEAFELSDSADFTPGNALEIKLGYDSKNQEVFRGVIKNVGIRNDKPGSNFNKLIVRCHDKAVSMTSDTNNAFYKDQKDSEIISTLINNHGLNADVEATAITHKQLIQYQESDWDFVLRRAQANGFLVYTMGNTVTVKKPLENGTADLGLEIGRDVINFDCSTESSVLGHAAKGHTASDLKNQALLKAKSDKSGQSATTTIPTPRSSTYPKKGKVTFTGSSRAKLNTMIELAGFGDRYNGNVLISKIQHKLKAGQWETSIEFGQLFDKQKDQKIKTIDGFSGINGLQTGRVKKIDADPSGALRVLVDIPSLESGADGVWARLSNFYATKGKGSFFFPEIGDEVALGFINNDPHSPILLGSLYSNDIHAPYMPDDKNSIKAFVSKNDLQIEFNDEDKILSIKTPGGNQFVLSDKDKSITLKDQNANKIEMGNSGISLNSAKDITVKAAGKIELNAATGITAKASGGDVNLEGLNVQAKAKIAFSAQGTASAELKASGNTSVKGAMVMIN